MDKRQEKRLKKILINILAKNPAEFLLVGSEDGWIRIADLHKALMEEKLMPFMTPKTLEQYFTLYRPQEFEICQGKRLVRARPQHVAEGTFIYAPKEPPPFLFVPIRPKAYFAVEKGGIGPQHGKKWLILCASRQRATILGKRFHPKPLIVKVEARSAHLSGHPFHYAGSELYLTRQRLEPTWLKLPPIPAKEKGLIAEKTQKDEVKAKAKPEKPVEEYEEKPFLPGSFTPSAAYFEEFSREKERRARRRSHKSRIRKKRKR